MCERSLRLRSPDQAAGGFLLQAPPGGEHVIGYVVAVGQAATSDFTVFRLNSAQTRTYQMTGLETGRSYYVKVAAYNEGGVGPYSSLATAGTPQTGGWVGKCKWLILRNCAPLL